MVRVKPFIHMYIDLHGWLYVYTYLKYILDILILGKSPIKWRQRPYFTIAFDWDVKRQFLRVPTINVLSKNIQNIKNFPVKFSSLVSERNL